MSWPPLRDDLAGAEPYGAPQLDVPVQLNVNENPYAPGAEVVADIATAVSAASSNLNRYPDREATGLRADLAAYANISGGAGISVEQVWAANGSNEIMHQILLAFGGPGRVAMSFDPTYSMYPEYARDTHTDWITGSRREDFQLDLVQAHALIRQHRPTVMMIPSPNNPTGTALPLADVKQLCEAMGDGVVVVDEAYAEFRRSGTPSALQLLPQHRNLLVTRTLSKAFALAGARVGYVVADPQIIDALRIVRLPYHLSAITQAAARAALAHADTLLAQVNDLRTERDQLVTWLQDQGYRVAESDANFVFFGLFDNRHRVWQGLLDRGVLIRETGPEGWLRVSVGTPAEMAAFKSALEEVTQ